LRLLPAGNQTTAMDVNGDGVFDPVDPPTFLPANPLVLPDALSHVWANRENRPERQDEDLFSSRSPSPPLESFESGGGQDLNDDEVELSDLSSESEEELLLSRRAIYSIYYTGYSTSYLR